jgi:hypothetical protein
MMEVVGRLRVIINMYDMGLVILGRWWLLVELGLIINIITAIVRLARVIFSLLEGNG